MVLDELVTEELHVLDLFGCQLNVDISNLKAHLYQSCWFHLRKCLQISIRRASHLSERQISVLNHVFGEV